MQYAYIADAQVSSVTPSEGSVSGGSVVTVVGSGFRSGAELACRFGYGRSGVVGARWLSSSEAECAAPSRAAGNTTVEISNNGADFSISSTKFQYSVSISTLGLSLIHI